MPELPDLTIYIESLQTRIVDQRLLRIRLASPFVLRSVDPPIDEVRDKKVIGIRRIGKRIVFALDHELFLVVHLMIAGRFHWKKPGARVPGKVGLAGLDFPGGSLVLTEASSKKRASIYLVEGEHLLDQFDRGGLEVMNSSYDDFRHSLFRENHTLKRSLTDPRLFSAIGNAYSDEILHSAGLSPLKLTQKLSEPEVERLHRATKQTLTSWIDRLRKDNGTSFPEHVTAFHPDMAVHGKYGQPCPACGTKIQRIVYSENECNYCPRCQTEGKLLADRSLSRLLKDDWPESIDELELREGA